MRERELVLQAELQAALAAAKEAAAAEALSVSAPSGPHVTEADVATIVSQWTGIPIEKVGELGTSWAPC